MFLELSADRQTFVESELRSGFAWKISVSPVSGLKPPARNFADDRAAAALGGYQLARRHSGRVMIQESTCACRADVKVHNDQPGDDGPGCDAPAD